MKAWAGIAGGAAVLIGGGIGISAIVGRHKEQLRNAPQTAAQLGAHMIRNFDRDSRNGDFSGAVDIASEGVRVIAERSHTSTGQGSAPRSSMTEMPIGSKPTVRYTYNYDRIFEGEAFWKAADTSGDGSVDESEVVAFLASYAAASGDAKVLEESEMATLRKEFRSAFDGVEKPRR